MLHFHFVAKISYFQIYYTYYEIFTNLNSDIPLIKESDFSILFHFPFTLVLVIWKNENNNHLVSKKV